MLIIKKIQKEIFNLKAFIYFQFSVGAQTTGWLRAEQTNLYSMTILAFIFQFQDKPLLSCHYTWELLISGNCDEEETQSPEG